MIYLDETWLNESECMTRDTGLAEKHVGRKVKARKGARYFIVHAGGEDGFVPGALLFRSVNGYKKPYDDINDACFQSWFQTVTPKHSAS